MPPPSAPTARPDGYDLALELLASLPPAAGSPLALKDLAREFGLTKPEVLARLETLRRVGVKYRRTDPARGPIRISIAPACRVVAETVAEAYWLKVYGE